MDKQQDYEEGFTGLKGTVVGRPLICQPKRKLVRADWSRLKKGGEGERWRNGRREAFRILKQNEEDIEKGHKGMGPVFLKYLNTLRPLTVHAVFSLFSGSSKVTFVGVRAATLGKTCYLFSK